LPSQSASCTFWYASVPGTACLRDVLPHLDGLHVDRVTSTGGGVEIEARCRSAGAACPACGAWSFPRSNQLLLPREPDPLARYDVAGTSLVRANGHDCASALS
jgi:hypothetical protein